MEEELWSGELVLYAWKSGFLCRQRSSRYHAFQLFPYLKRNHPRDLMMESVSQRDCQGEYISIHTASVSSTWGGRRSHRNSTSLSLTTSLPWGWEWGRWLLVETLTKGPRGFLSKPLSHLAWLTWKFWGANPKAEHLSYSPRWFMQERD